jgi:hypothetical protein
MRTVVAAGQLAAKSSRPTAHAQHAHLGRADEYDTNIRMAVALSGRINIK